VITSYSEAVKAARIGARADMAVAAARGLVVGDGFEDDTDYLIGFRETDRFDPSDIPCGGSEVFVRKADGMVWSVAPVYLLDKLDAMRPVTLDPD